MKPMRLAIIARKFWPMSGSAELAVGELASELKRLGHQVEIITAKWQKNWPSHFDIRGVPVTRITKPTGGPWGSFRYQRSLARTLGELRPIDGIVLFGAGDEIEVISRSLPGVPVIARVDYRETPYESWKTSARKKSILELEQATAIAVDSAMTLNRLLECGLDAKRISIVPDGVSLTQFEVRNYEAQSAARQAISDAHPVLAIGQVTKLVVTGAPMDSDGGLLDLVSAWSIVVEEFPKAKLWLLGDGSHARYLWEHITSRDLVYNAIMPGFFDDLSDVFMAADLYVHPLRTARSCSIFTKAAASGLSAVVTDSEFTREWVSKNETGMMTKPRNPESLAEAILHGLKNSDLCDRFGNECQKKVRRDLSIETEARKFLHLLSPQHDPVVTIGPVNRRILFITDSDSPLGDAQQLNILLAELSKQDFEIQLGLLQRECTPAQRERFGAQGITVHCLRKSARRDFRMYERVKRLVKSTQPEIVHSWCGNSGPVTALALSRSQSPSFVHTELSYVKEAPLHRELLERAFCRHPDRWVIPHVCLTENMVKRGARPHRITVVANSADSVVLDRRESRKKIIARLGLPDTAIIVGQVAPLVPKMRLKDSIWAADLLACVREDVHFVLIGAGPQEWRLKKFLSQTEASGHVHFVDPSNIACKGQSWLAGLDVYWHSHLQRPLDGCLLAAMSLGIPVVSVYGAGTEEIVIPQTSGLATNFGARDELARWTKYLIEQTESTEKISQQGKAHVALQFPVKAMVDGYKQIYDDITN